MSWEHIQASKGRMQEDFVKEIAALQYLSKFINGTMNNPRNVSQQIMANQSEVFIVMPYCANGDILVQVSESTLLNPYQGTPCLTEAAAKYWFRQMLTGLRTLQNARLGWHETFNIEANCVWKSALYVTGVATHQPFDGHAVDIYSTGTVLLFMLTGLRLTGPITQDRMFDSMEPSQYGLSVDAMDLLRKMFRLNPVDRLTLDEILTHRFLQT
ncbi:hypothetical protein QTG54_008302 [Skeletonema marinoi]|uniref:Protein kinase domain-containing protein n=1 Tax=Skeletonema marinoi TaxID=267567 RepID=A0AAD8Y9Q6_9STRA|nr:hypothetical protein QTG54_008302 [Skeletonema marinoi]